MLGVIMVNGVIHNVNILNRIMLCVVVGKLSMLSVIIQSVTKLNVVAPK